MFDKLSEKLDKALHILKGQGSITEVNVAETLKEVRRALLDADVNFKIAKDFTNRVKENAMGQNVLTSLQPGQLMVIELIKYAKSIGCETFDMTVGNEGYKRRFTNKISKVNTYRIYRSRMKFLLAKGYFSLKKMIRGLESIWIKK